MSLYHEAASVLGPDAVVGGNLRSRVFNNKDLKSPPGQVYALALETCKWSSILSEVIDNSQLLQHEKKLTPILALLLAHDFLLAKGGIALPSSHGLRATIERHKSRLTAEFTRARIRRKACSVEALAEHVEASLYANSQHPRWVRINTLKSTLADQLSTTFQEYQKVDSVQKVLRGTGRLLYVDEHIPNLVAVSPRFNFAKSDAYKSGAIILQDKASCFPAYLLDPQPKDGEEGDLIDGCAAPGNKTTHLAALAAANAQSQQREIRIHAFEKDPKRATTLEKMVKIAGSDSFTKVHPGHDFLKVDPLDDDYRNVTGILLDPSCSGSGIVGRDDMPELHLPAAAAPGPTTAKTNGKALNKKKRKHSDTQDTDNDKVMVDDDGNTTVVASEKDWQARLEALSAFQLTILLHAFRFPAARKITYSTCSVHAEENEHVVTKALQSDLARRRGWRILPRAQQVAGMQAWPVRGQVESCEGGNVEVAEGCIRAFKDDGRGVMGFFVAAFVRDGETDEEEEGDATERQIAKTTNNKKKKKKSKGVQEPATMRNHEARTTVEDEEGSDWSGFDD